MINFFYTIIFSLVFFSCASNEERILSARSLVKTTEFNFQGRINRYFVDENFIHIYGSPYENIRSYSYMGELVEEIGRKGPADWEISSVWWYGREDSTYTIYDYGKNLINQFDLVSGRLETSYPFVGKSNISNISLTEYISTRINEKGEFEFAVIDIEKNEIARSYPVIELLKEVGISDLKDLDWLLYGDFAKSEKDEGVFVYYCLNSPVFFKLDLNKDEVVLYKDFRFQFMPEVYRSGSNVVLTPMQNWFVSGGIIGDEIFLLTVKNNDFYVEITSKWFLDIYDLASGDYKESIPIELTENYRYPFEIRNGENKLVIGFDFEKIIVYEVQ